jgi:CheY-like chemotaxis protein
VRVPHHDRETSVLVVDDDRQVRRFVTDSLQSLGYRVVDMAAGASALALLNESRFDLLIVDFAMPGMNGVEVARAARRQQPGLRILIISGYADSAAIESVASTATLLRKPFDLTGLGAAVAQVLGGEVTESG